MKKFISAIILFILLFQDCCSMSTDFHLAAERGDIKILKLEINEYSKEFDIVNLPDLNGRTALMLSAREGHTDAVRFLLDNGADINAVDHNGMSAVYLAANEGHIDTVKLLINRGSPNNSTVVIALWGGVVKKYIILILTVLFLLVGFLFRKKIIKKVEAQKAKALSSDSEKEIKNQENL